MEKKDFWIKFYPAPWTDPGDFISSLTLEETGAYIRLLMVQAQEGKIPEDEVNLAKLLGVSLDVFQPIWKKLSKKFQPSGDGQGLINLFMEGASSEAKKRIESSQKANQIKSTGFSMSKQDPVVPKFDLEFLWQSFPKNLNPRKTEAMTILKIVVKTINDYNNLLAAIGQYKVYLKRQYVGLSFDEQRRYTKAMDRWLDDDWMRWIRTEEGILDCTPLWKKFPQRSEPQDTQVCVEAMSSIVGTSQAEFDRMASAIDAYKLYIAKEFKGEERIKYTKTLKKWLTEWEKWVPSEIAPKAPVEPAHKDLFEKASWLRNHDFLKMYPKGVRFPWEGNWGETPQQVEAAKAKYWPPEVLRDWLDNERKK